MKTDEKKQLLLEQSLLSALNRALTLFITSTSSRGAFEALLNELLQITQSEYGLIGRVLRDENGTPYIKTLAITNIAWNEEMLAYHDEHVAEGLELRSTDSLFGRILTTGETIIANDASNDSRGSGVPHGHPSLNTFLGFPIYADTDLVGILGVANNPEGYSQQTVELLTPFTAVCAQLINAYKALRQREEIEKKLSNAIDFRDQLLDQAAEGIVVWRLSHTDTFAEFITWNRRMQEITGYTKEEINSIGWLKAVYADERQREQARSTMIQVIEGTTNHGKDFSAVTKSGDHKILHIASSPISGENNEPCVLAIVDDVTKNREQQDLLKTSKRRFQTLFDSSTDGIFILDMQGNFIDLNRTAHERLDYTKEEMLASNIKVLDPPEFAEKIPARMKQIIESGSAVFESAHYRKDGSIMPVEINARLLELEGEQIILSIVRDISERKTLEEQLRHSQKMESIGTLVGGIAHDFNNMLAAVQGNVYLAKKQLPEHAAAGDKLDNIEKLSKRAANMVQQLLTFARKDIVQMRVLSLNRFMEEGYTLTKTAIPENIDYKTSICEERLNINGDTTQLQQVMFNLLNNAVDAVAEAPRPEIRCTLEHFDADRPFLHAHPDAMEKEFARITVKDNGQGIPTEYINQIFEPFFTTKEVGKGTGLGLSMLYGAIQTHGGIVEVESKPGSGTAIHVYLPLSEESPEILPEKQPGNSEKHDLTILLVDDEDDLRKTTAQVLIEMGYRVVEAANGEAALELFTSTEQEVDLVLTDVIMPKMGGIKLLQALRELNAKIPVILTTGYDDTVLDKGFHPTRCEVARKPFDFELLSNSIRTMIKESQS